LRAQQSGEFALLDLRRRRGRRRPGLVLRQQAIEVVGGRSGWRRRGRRLDVLGAHPCQVVGIGSFFSRYPRFQRSHPLPQRGISRQRIGDYVGSTILVAGLQEADLVLGREGLDLRQ
jgi:hypothetical protein